MAFANASPAVLSLCCVYRINNGSNFQKEEQKVSVLGSGCDTSSVAGITRFCCVGSYLKKRSTDYFTCKFRLNAVDARIAENAQTKSTIDIPVTCYQLIGVPDRAEKDEIVKSVMNLKRAEIEEGYTMDVVVSRQDLLMDVRDKLLFEPEYAGNIKGKIPPKSSLRIPFSWLPGAMCLLQEVGELKLVLDIGRAAIQCPDAKPYTHDLILSMALAECALAKIGFEKNKVSQGFEALARAQSLLRSKTSVGKIALLSQIEESLEELAPACTLELLGMPHSPENADRRQGAISALRELLRQGLDVESSCQVHDWPCFLSQALNILMATEIVDLLPWDDLAVIRKNKKSLESQNQRVVIDSNSLYRAFKAHLALGISSKQKDLINKAKGICECLMASDGLDLKFEEAFCLFLLGQGTEAEAIEKFKQLELNSNPTKSSILGKVFDASAANPSMEMWLKDVVLAVFPDTKDCSPSLANYFDGENKIYGTKKSKGAPQTVPSICCRPLSSTLTSGQKVFDESRTFMNSSHHLASPVKQLAPPELQSSLLSGKNNDRSNISDSSSQLKRDISIPRSKIMGIWLARGDLVGRFTFAAVLGCIMVAMCKLPCINFRKTKTGTQQIFRKPCAYTDSISWKRDSSSDYSLGPAFIEGSNIAHRLKKLLEMIKIQVLNQSDARSQSNLHGGASFTSSMANVYRRQMSVEEAEMLVKQWQMIKAEALGCNHQINNLSEVLDESMLAQWQALADAAREKSCYWKFVLLKLSVLQANILPDVTGLDMAEIEAVLEEAAELVDDSQQKNPNYYSTYKVRYILRRQEDGSWRFCKCDVQTL